jgi:hypothetical protein
MNDRKSVSGMPLPGAASRPVAIFVEARVARRRLWPSTIVYGAASTAILLFAVHRYWLFACLPWLADLGDASARSGAHTYGVVDVADLGQPAVDRQRHVHVARARSAALRSRAASRGGPRS